MGLGRLSPDDGCGFAAVDWDVQLGVKHPPLHGLMKERMSFLDQIFARLESSADQTLLTELGESGPRALSGRELLARISRARAFLAERGLQKGDRVALLAANGIDWIVMDLAIIAEGLVVVPLYSRQAPSELVTMMKD